MLNKVWLYLGTGLQTSCFPSLHNSSVSFRTLHEYYVKPRHRFNVLDNEQKSTGFLKNVENIVKPNAGKKESQKRKILYLYIYVFGSSHVRESGPKKDT